MGMSQGVYITGWLIYYIIIGFIVSLVMTMFMVFGVFSNEENNIVDGYTWVNIAFLYFLYTVAVVAFVMAISTFFKRAKTAAQATSFNAPQLPLYSASSGVYIGVAPSPFISAAY